jgi:hypothetical protein
MTNLTMRTQRECHAALPTRPRTGATEWDHQLCRYFNEPDAFCEGRTHQFVSSVLNLPYVSGCRERCGSCLRRLRR